MNFFIFTVTPGFHSLPNCYLRKDSYVQLYVGWPQGGKQSFDVRWRQIIYMETVSKVTWFNILIGFSNYSYYSSVMYFFYPPYTIADLVPMYYNISLLYIVYIRFRLYLEFELCLEFKFNLSEITAADMLNMVSMLWHNSVDQWHSSANCLRTIVFITIAWIKV